MFTACRYSIRALVRPDHTDAAKTAIKRRFEVPASEWWESIATDPDSGKTILLLEFDGRDLNLDPKLLRTLATSLQVLNGESADLSASISSVPYEDWHEDWYEEDLQL